MKRPECTSTSATLKQIAEAGNSSISPYQRPDSKTRDCEWFSSIDINFAFWAIPIRQNDCHKTGFVTQQGLYVWSSMPFGLKNSPEIFQRIMTGIIRKHRLSNFCLCYIDDILIFSKTFEEHLLHLKALSKGNQRRRFRN